MTGPPKNNRRTNKVPLTPTRVVTNVRRWAVKEERTILDLLARLVHYRLIIPIKRGRRNPAWTARGVAIGLACAFTPTVGIQMLLVAALWSLAKLAAPRFTFNLLVAMAWTWVSNVLTAPFFYYMFLVTGNVMMRDPDPFTSFDVFRTRLEDVMAADSGFIESLWLYTEQIFAIWGAPMMMGCIPWVILSGWLGYVWCLRFLSGMNRRRKKKSLIEAA